MVIYIMIRSILISETYAQPPPNTGSSAHSYDLPTIRRSGYKGYYMNPSPAVIIAATLIGTPAVEESDAHRKLLRRRAVLHFQVQDAQRGRAEFLALCEAAAAAAEREAAAAEREAAAASTGCAAFGPQLALQSAQCGAEQDSGLLAGVLLDVYLGTGFVLRGRLDQLSAGEHGVELGLGDHVGRLRFPARGVIAGEELDALERLLGAGAQPLQDHVLLLLVHHRCGCVPVGIGI
mmetsp:Transcript_7843/g.13529  ORF Transcript_7843/g.13529 Transcript_7843/m.13529 type:complete len:235 (+) Transcript_7843:38-742(+)